MYTGWSAYVTSCGDANWSSWIKRRSRVGKVRCIAGASIVAGGARKNVFHPVRALRHFALCLSNELPVPLQPDQVVAGFPYKFDRVAVLVLEVDREHDHDLGFGWGWQHRSGCLGPHLQVVAMLKERSVL